MQENQQFAVLARAAERLAALKPGPRMYLEIRRIAAELDVFACRLAQAERDAVTTEYPPHHRKTPKHELCIQILGR